MNWRRSPRLPELAVSEFEAVGTGSFEARRGWRVEAFKPGTAQAKAGQLASPMHRLLAIVQLTLMNSCACARAHEQAQHRYIQALVRDRFA